MTFVMAERPEHLHWLGPQSLICLGQVMNIESASSFAARLAGVVIKPQRFAPLVSPMFGTVIAVWK